MAGHDIGCLAVTEGSDPKGKVIGVISERDYIKKVAIHGLSSKDIKVSAVCTYGVQNLVVAANDEPIDECMKKMIERDIRHLLIRDRDGDVMSMLSIKDLVKMVVVRHNIVVRKLTDFALGKSVFYSSD
jgi:CBS domain-containing protein